MHLRYGDQVLLAGDTKDEKRCAEKLAFVASALMAEIKSLEDFLGDFSSYGTYFRRALVRDYLAWPAQIVDSFEPSDCMVFEGAQGVMLDEKHGTAPHNTWTNTTFENADTLLDEASVHPDERIRIGCFRTYYTRHGAGPFPTEDNTLDLPEPHNGNDGFQGKFRVGHFDFFNAKKAINIVGGVDYLSVSHIDYLPKLGLTESEFLGHLEDELEVPVGMIGRGPTAGHRMIGMEVLA